MPSNHNELYLLDTNLVSQLIVSQLQSSRLFEHVRRLAMQEQLVICEAVIFEVERGLYQRQAERQFERFSDSVLPLLIIEPVRLEDWKGAALLWAELRRRGRQLSDVDLVLAAVALRLDAVLVTADADFAAIPLLLTENWLLG